MFCSPIFSCQVQQTDHMVAAALSANTSQPIHPLCFIMNPSPPGISNDEWSAGWRQWRGRSAFKSQNNCQHQRNHWTSATNSICAGPWILDTDREDDNNDARMTRQDFSILPTILCPLSVSP